ncbi:MAG TPA: carboxypeptidase-like regulatory domain-containing protein, partial [Bacteroidia bacterium]
MSRSVSFFLTVILSLLILPSSFGQNGKLVGRVTDSANGEGLMMAIIRIDSTTLKCTADEKGNFVINDIPPGMYTVRVNFDGYKPKEIH